MKNKKENKKGLKGKNDIFYNIKKSVKNSFGILFNSFDKAFKEKGKKEANNKPEYELKMPFEYSNKQKELLISQEEDKKLETNQSKSELLERKIEQRVNKILLLEELSELRKNMSSIEKRIAETANSKMDNGEKEKIFLNLKDETEELDQIYTATIEPNVDIIEEDTEFEKLQISKLLQMCDEELTQINKYKELKYESESETIHAIIDENLKEQAKDIDLLRKNVRNMEYSKKRCTLVHEIHEFLSKTIDIGYNLLPYSISKNKVIAILVSAVVLDNRVRNVRKIMRKENENIKFIKHKNIINELQEETKCISKAQELLEDALHQVETLKQEFLMEFYYDMDRYPETEDIMIEFASIEYEITSKKIELEEKI